jgi:hypothetical protein
MENRIKEQQLGLFREIFQKLVGESYQQMLQAKMARRPGMLAAERQPKQESDCAGDRHHSRLGRVPLNDLRFGGLRTCFPGGLCNPDTPGHWRPHQGNLHAFRHLARSCDALRAFASSC